MSNSKFGNEFKRDAVAQITERGDPVREVSERLWCSAYSLYAWKKKFAKASSGEAEKDAEIRRLETEFARVSEERDILKKGEACPPLVRGQCRARLPPAMPPPGSMLRMRLPGRE